MTATVEVDPLEAVLNLCKAHTALNTITGGRIDNQHHYGQDSGEWAQNANSMILTPTGGPPELYTQTWKLQLEARCYGDTPYDAGQVAKALTALTRPSQRYRIAVTEGFALIYYFVPRGQLRLDFDEEVRPLGGMPFYSLQLEAEVAELTVT